MGGLGNQLFEIAAAYALAIRNNTTSCFDFNACNTPLQGNTSNKYRNNILSKVKDGTVDYFRGIYNEPKFSYNELPNVSELILNGYFQSEEYFKDFKTEIIELFKIEDTQIIDDYLVVFREMNRPITTIHVRRGDYLANSEFHNVLETEYYKKAMKEIGDSSFIFVSDDIEWVKKNFKGPNIWYSNFSNEIDDFKLLTLCDNNIIANSSFSWWGAYLNKNPNKKIIAPNKWFGPKGPQDTENLIPQNWIKL